MTSCYRVIQPRDPLICRDGRPFAAGLRGRTMDWPYPSVIIGTARTNLIPGSEFHDGAISAPLAELLLGISQRGPLPAWRSVRGWEVAFPAPADALPAKSSADADGAVAYFPLRPRTLTESGTDLSLDERNPGLLPAVAVGAPAGKPPSDLPRFWKKDEFLRWLDHGGHQPLEFETAKMGLWAPLRDTRTHVVIAEETQTSVEGGLFSTEALDFGPVAGKRSAEENAESEGALLARPAMGLYSEFRLPEAASGLDATQLCGLLPLGGEGRLSSWQSSSDLLAGLQPTEMSKAVLETGCLRLILLTPAWFEHGWQAGWMRRSQLDLRSGAAIGLQLVGACVPRFAPISGWDLYRRQPKPTRFLAPAGSTYFFRLSMRERVTEHQLEELWLSSVSDEPEDGRSLRRDGFGLAVFGPWSEALQVS